MSKLYVKHGTMGAGKTLDLLRVVYQYKRRDKKVWTLKLDISDRGEGVNKIQSRLEGSSTPAEPITKHDNILVLLDQRVKKDIETDVIIIDESQFLSGKQVEQLYRIAHLRGIPVLTYALKTTFKGEFFKGSKRLFELGDSFDEIIGLCWCGKRAKFNARVVNGKVVMDGEEVLVGDEMYIPLCPKHFLREQLKEM